MALRALSLCSGIGGLDLGLQLALPGCRTVCYVERDTRKAGILEARIRDGWLDDAPIWDELESFQPPQAGIVYAGYPCRPFSSAAHGANTEESLWPHVARVIRESGARAVFLENVAGDPGAVRWLHGAGFVVHACIVKAAFLGAPHLRERVFTLGLHTDANGQPAIPIHEEAPRLPQPTSAHRGPWDDHRGDLPVDDGVPHGVDDAGAYGDACIPLVAAHAFRTLAARAGLTP